MPRNELTDYINGKIYEIVCKVTGLVYVGSTTMTLPKRMESHHCISNSCHSKKVLAAGDYAEALIELFPCNNEKELVARENIFIKQYQDLYGELCVNRETFLTRPQYNAMYYQQDAQKQRDRVKKYREANLELVHAQKAERIECEYCGDMVQRQSKEERTH